MLASFKSGTQTPNNKRLSKDNFFSKGNDFVNDITVSLEGKNINFKNEIVCKNNRYYFEVSNFEKVFGYSIKVIEDKLYAYKEIRKTDEANKDYVERNLLHPCVTYDKTNYISMIDLTEALNLTATWNYEKKELSFYKVREKFTQESRSHRKRPALIRFEDVSAGETYTSSDNLQKMRIVSDFMYSKAVPFHIAWIPRYKDPENGIDNDLLTIYSLSNVDFVYTLDYMISKGGIVGLHGYTHQYGNEQSVIGSEFGDNLCSTLEETKARIEASISTAKNLDIPYSFFESPHYSSSKEQQQTVFENYFDYMFEASKAEYTTKPYLSKNNNKTIYVPAPLGYVYDGTGEGLMEKIRNKPQNYIAGFFYHPSIEFKFINLTTDKGYPEYEYSNTSVLHKILNCLSEEGYTPVKITDIKLGKQAKKTQGM
jgi:hypothetical protein